MSKIEKEQILVRYGGSRKEREEFLRGMINPEGKPEVLNDVTVLDESGEKQLCPTGAIRRAFVEDPYFEYTIDETKCIGCALCVKGCGSYGNGSLYLQVRHDRCVNCNECRIAQACPSGAISRIAMETPCIRKDAEHNPVPANRPARFRI